MRNLQSYAGKTDADLKFIIEDAGEAALAMRGHSPTSEGKYLDQINDACSILYQRRTRKTKKYGSRPRKISQT